ncbi:phospholipase D family protein [Paraburkholderia sp. BCC1884]|uniref:phospholipase D family protein n=1 Tax=Paraburkholderia sp. BCC1884 TaxID=2562668 RepID=UPI00118308DE|nr:phospholipase D family protein [Paraburkholderia sp. BCC1884]
MQLLAGLTLRLPRRWLRTTACLLICANALAGCALPSLAGRTQSSALDTTEAQSTQIGHAIAPEVAAHPGLSGIYPLANPQSAFASRMILARAAQRTLDVQYYIWHDDLTGTLLLEQLREAADRGVRVRLLLDDNGVAPSLDATLAALGAHPNFEVRLFNPFVVRKPKSLGFLTDFSRANRRMHNKSITADSSATIVGGRNIGDEYFGATDGVVFSDLDVLAVGPAASDVARDFDRYWSSDSAYPVDRILPSANADRLQALASRAQQLELEPAGIAYIDAVRELPIAEQLQTGTLPLEWAKARMISDDPAKGLNQAASKTRVLQQMHDILGEPAEELDLVSPYFVPTQAGVQYFTQLASKGVAVRVLTNALESTDVAAVHSGYARRRVALLKGGVQLYELRRLPGAPGKKDESKGSFGSSGSSLHAKTFAVDAQRVFVGSFNFDPRSANLNTELGFVIDSPVLAGKITTIFHTVVPQVAYTVRLDDQGKVYWLEDDDGKQTRYDTEPNSSWLGRLGVWFMSILPIESFL